MRYLNYRLLFILIFLLALFLRSYNFSNRWDLGGDSARDALIAKEALLRKELPLIGSFSSAGPFVFGPAFYWFIMLSYSFLPFTVTAPWIMGVVVGVVTVFILMFCGWLIGGRNLSILVGLLAATSPQLVARSLILGQHSFIAITTAWLILNFLLLWQKRNLFYAALLGLSLGLAISLHYQALNLLVFLPGMFLIKSLSFRKKIGSLFLIIGGVIIPLLPLLIWDSRQGWANTRNIFDYFLIAQYRLYVPNSWRLFLFKYSPDYWSFVAGRYLLVGLILMIIFIVLFFFLWLKKNFSRELVALGVIFGVMMIISRYYRGERSEGYFVYLAPLIIIFTGWTIKTLLKEIKIGPFWLSKVLAVTIFSLVLIGNLLSCQRLLTYNSHLSEKQAFANRLVLAYPEEKFSLFDYEFRGFNVSSALSLLLSVKGKTARDGHPIGVFCLNENQPELPLIESIGSCAVLDLHKVDGLDSGETHWGPMNQESVYDDLIGWSKKNQLTSSFSFDKYFDEKLKGLLGR